MTLDNTKTAPIDGEKPAVASELAPSVPLRAPFPWFGGKSRVAHLVWDRFGPVRNYVEPFFGSGAVLLGRPPRNPPKTETVNDLDGYVANFWRAISRDPEAVAFHADNPVNENDLHARHSWLVGERDTLRARLEGHPDFFDSRIAGYWVWGLSVWIGSEFCSGKGPWTVVDGQLVQLGDAGVGVHRKRVHLGDAGVGVKRQLVHLGRSQGVRRQGASLLPWFSALAARLERVRVCSGDWSRVCGPSVTTKHGQTAVFLDPPYADTAERAKDLYTEDCLDVAHDVRRWAIEQGDDPLMRIALCGYEGEHEMPDSWECVPWKAVGGYGSQNGNGIANAHKERIWFSPHCVKPETQGLFEFL